MEHQKISIRQSFTSSKLVRGSNEGELALPKHAVIVSIETDSVRGGFVVTWYTSQLL